MVRDGHHTDPCRPLPGSNVDGALEALRDDIARQEEIVRMLRERRAARAHVLADVRVVLAAGRTVESAALDTEAAELKAVMGVDNAECEADGQVPPTHTESAETSPSAPAAVRSSRVGAVSTAADLAELLHSVEASLARASRLVHGPDEDHDDAANPELCVDATATSAADGMSGPPITMDDLLGLNDVETAPAQDEPSAQAKKRRARRRKKAARQAEAEASRALVSGAAGTAAALSKHEQDARRALFAAVDAVANTLAPCSDASITKEAGPSSGTPAWLLDDDTEAIPTPEGSDAQTGGGEIHSCANASSRGAHTDGTAGECTPEALADYPDDFEDVDDDNDAVDRQM